MYLEGKHQAIARLVRICIHTLLYNIVGKLTGLHELNLGGNKLRILPSAIGQLSKLQSLILDRNELQVLPDTITNLTGK